MLMNLSELCTCGLSFSVGNLSELCTCTLYFSTNYLTVNL